MAYLSHPSNSVVSSSLFTLPPEEAACINKIRCELLTVYVGTVFNDKVLQHCQWEADRMVHFFRQAGEMRIVKGLKLNRDPSDPNGILMDIVVDDQNCVTVGARLPLTRRE